MGPFIHFRWARLDELFPGIACLNERYAIRDEDTINFMARDLRIFDDKKVHKVLDKGQMGCR